MYAQKKPIDNTHIVREKDRQRHRELLAVLFLGVPIGLFLLLFTWQNLEVIRLGSEATRLQKQLKDVEATHKQLASELDRLTSFASVEQQATQLGFERTDPKTIVMVESSATPTRSSEFLGVPRSSSAGAPVTAAGPATPPRNSEEPEEPRGTPQAAGGH